MFFFINTYYVDLPAAVNTALRKLEIVLDEINIKLQVMSFMNELLVVTTHGQRFEAELLLRKKTHTHTLKSA